MAISVHSTTILTQINKPETKLGDLRILAKSNGKDHKLATELWDTNQLYPRLLSILVMDTKKLDADFVNKLLEDIQTHDYDDRLHLTDWLMANQLTKDKKMIALINSWQESPQPLKRRIFWYYQGRLRWVGQIPPPNTEILLLAIEQNLLDEVPEVQWAMNFTAGWIGIFDKSYRDNCLRMGERIGLYKDEIVPKGCTPNYLPKFISLEVEKRKL